MSGCRCCKLITADSVLRIRPCDTPKVKHHQEEDHPTAATSMALHRTHTATMIRQGRQQTGLATSVMTICILITVICYSSSYLLHFLTSDIGWKHLCLITYHLLPWPRSTSQAQPPTSFAVQQEQTLKCILWTAGACSQTNVSSGSTASSRKGASALLDVRCITPRVQCVWSGRGPYKLHIVFLPGTIMCCVVSRYDLIPVLVICSPHPLHYHTPLSVTHCAKDAPPRNC
jgi:hypothetical protein